MTDYIFAPYTILMAVSAAIGSHIGFMRKEKR
jgi:hypothetical protein